MAVAESLRGFNPATGADAFLIPYIGSNPTVPILLPDGRIAVVTASNNTLHRIDRVSETVTSTSILHFAQRPNPIVDSQGTLYTGVSPTAIAALSNTDTVLFTRSFAILPENLSLGSNSTLYVPAIDAGQFK